MHRRNAGPEDCPMANLNKVMLIGRLTREPETRMFSNGGKVARFGFAVNNRKKNTQTGQWEDEPVFLECEVFNRGETGTLADRIEQTVHKGQQIFIEGHLKLDQWNDKTTGDKRSMVKVVIDNFQYLERREDGGGGSYQRSTAGPRAASPPGENFEHAPEPEMEPPTAARPADEDIPF
jgi:single-strand DNA-binding protein